MSIPFTNMTGAYETSSNGGPNAPSNNVGSSIPSSNVEVMERVHGLPFNDIVNGGLKGLGDATSIFNGLMQWVQENPLMALLLGALVIGVAGNAINLSQFGLGGTSKRKRSE